MQELIKGRDGGWGGEPVMDKGEGTEGEKKVGRGGENWLFRSLRVKRKGEMFARRKRGERTDG